MISRIARPSSRLSVASSRRICACTVTSSAVVGSSATSSSGSHISAIAIMTRWRKPPESWCGNWPSRISGAVMPTRPISSTARSSAAAREPPLWRVSTSAICEPIVKAGLRLVIGSWKIIDMRLPRSRAISRSDSDSRSVPAKLMRFADALAAAREQAHDRERGHRLAAAGFADQAMGLALLDPERGAAHRRGAAAERHLQVLDLQQRAHRSRSAPSRLRNPSPTRLMPSTRTSSATPGIMITQGEKNM